MFRRSTGPKAAMKHSFAADKLRLLVLAGATVFASIVLLTGFLRLQFTGGDLHLGWTEEQYVLRGVNPYDAYIGSLPADTNRPPGPFRAAAVHEDLGSPNPSYPPWTYGTLAPILWPDEFVNAKACYALVNA